MGIGVRRVVTGPGGYDQDGEPPNAAGGGGLGVCELLWLDGRPRGAEVEPDRRGDGWPLEPPPGGLSSRVVRLPGGADWLRVAGDADDRPGMHATDTLDLVVVLDGEIELGLPAGDVVVGAGEVVVQRGTEHRWRVRAERPCTYWVTMLRPDRAAAPPPALPRAGGDSGVRRLVTRADGGVDVDEAPVGLAAGTTRILDAWHTGGPLTDVGQGGDPPGPWTLEPPPGGACLRILELAGGGADADADRLWHATATVDVDVVLAGRIAHDLRPGGTVELGPGDCLLQRGTEHRWRPLGDEPVRLATLMLAVQP